MSVQFTILGSGSGGNCAYLEAGETRLLIDAGFSARQIRERLAGIGRSPESLTGIIVTHEHSDHVRGLGVLAGKLGLPVYCNRLTREAIDTTVQTRLNYRIFGTGDHFELGEIGIDTFSVPHDAYDPVGFLLHTSAGRIGFLTDLGHATKLILERVRTANVLLLEANHDHQLLTDDTRRPWSVKQRILSRHGHLSNEAAAKLATEIMNDGLKHLFLGHLSGDCNRPELALGCVQTQMDAIGARHVRVTVTSQEAAAPTLVLAGSAEPVSRQPALFPGLLG